jgi:hypothetical protein
MVKLIDFNKIDIIKLHEKKLKVINIAIEKNGLLDLNAQQLYDIIFAAINDKVVNAEISLIDNLWFEIDIKDNTIDDNDNSLYFLCANIIAANLIAGKDRSREKRLKVPSILNTKCLFGYIWLRDMVNKEMICNRVGGVVRINGNEVKII